jgi:hypothetical protein
MHTCFPTPRSALTEARKPSCVDRSVWIAVRIANILFGAGGKVLFRSTLRRGQRVRAGSVC